MANSEIVSSIIMSKIKEAADTNTILLITYADASNQPSIRTVEPYEIRDDTLFAYCRVKNGIRAFKLNRIQGAELHLGQYEPRFPVLI